MKLLVLCVGLFVGVVCGRPEGEASPVSPPEENPAEATVADPIPAEEVTAEDDAVRPKRWYYYPQGPYLGQGFPNPNFPNNFGMFPSPSVGTPVVSPAVSSRTRYAPNQGQTASFQELASFVERQRNPTYQNFPDVIDTSGFNPQFNQGFNPNFNQGFQQGFNPAFNQQRFNNEVETRTRFPQMRTSPSNGAYPQLVPPPQGFHGQWNNQYGPGFFPGNYYGYNPY